MSDCCLDRPFRGSGPFASCDILSERVEAFLQILEFNLRRAIVRDGCLSAFAGKHFASAHPNLTSNFTICRLRFGEAVIDVCAKGVQGHSALSIPFVTRHLSP